MSNDYLQPTIDPSNTSGPRRNARIPHEFYSWLYTNEFVKFRNLVAAKHVLENPKRIFEGVRVFHEGGWCFAGRPSIWTIKENVTAPFPDGYVFAVYLSSRFVVYEFRAERAAADDPDCPEDWKNRYSTLVWKSTS